MKNRLWLAALYAVIGFIPSAKLDAWSLPEFSLGRHRVWIAPQAYHMERLRKGGTYQSGWLGGIRGCIERDVVNGFYWGVEGAWAQGPLSGHTSSGRKIKSDMTEAEVEGRIGVTLGGGSQYFATITPFVGGGYYEGANSYVSPSPLTIKATTAYEFFTAGFLSKVWYEDLFSVGFNFKVRQMNEAKEKISHDPDRSNSTMLIGDRQGWIAELPLTTELFWNGDPFELGLVPFYEKRHYGGQENHPTDFYSTKYYIYGLRLLLGAYF